MPELTVYNIDGKKADVIDLPDSIFGKRVNKDIIHQVVVMYSASLRQGNASTKERADVSGGGKKPYRQKGTGQARAGSNRSPLWKGGGVTFGPHPRDFSYTVPKKIKKAALRESCNAKYVSEELTCIDEFKKDISKTKDFAKVLSKLKLKGKVLALLDDVDPIAVRASRNIPNFNVIRSVDVNAYDLMKAKRVLATKVSFKNLLKRLK